MSPYIVSTQWLADHLSAPDIAIVDASWHLPSEGRNATAEFESERIPGAVFFDIDEISDKTSKLPHMLPSPEQFSSQMRRLGVGDGRKIIIYDSLGLYSAPRAWWMFQVFGHNDVAVLDGGLKKWKAEGRPIDDMPPVKPQERHFTSRFQAMMVREKDDVSSALKHGTAVVADARSRSRFAAQEPEPRPGVRGGHMPGAKNVPFRALANDDGTIKSPLEIRQAFTEAGVDLSKPIITSCGSGITAAVLSLGLTISGNHNHSLYDGSWSEWGADPSLPVETGD